MRKGKKTSVKNPTLTIRVKNKSEADSLTNLKKLLNEKTSAGALMRAAVELPKAITTNQKLADENSKLRVELNKITNIVEQWLNSQNQLMAMQKSIKQLHKPYPVQN